MRIYVKTLTTSIHRQKRVFKTTFSVMWLSSTVVCLFPPLLYCYWIFSCCWCLCFEVTSNSISEEWQSAWASHMIDVRAWNEIPLCGFQVSTHSSSKRQLISLFSEIQLNFVHSLSGCQFFSNLTKREAVNYHAVHSSVLRGLEIFRRASQKSEKKKFFDKSTNCETFLYPLCDCFALSHPSCLEECFSSRSLCPSRFYWMRSIHEQREVQSLS